MKKVRRLAKSMVKAFPTVCVFEAMLALEAYRAGRDAGSRDWEGSREQFRWVMRAAIKWRHRVDK